MCQRLDYYYVEVAFVAGSCSCVYKIYVYIQTAQAAAYKCLCVDSTTYKYLREFIQTRVCLNFAICCFSLLLLERPNTVHYSLRLSSIECNDSILPFVSAVSWCVLVYHWWKRSLFGLAATILLCQAALSLTLHFSAIECLVLAHAHLLIRRTKLLFPFSTICMMESTYIRAWMWWYLT